VTGASGKRRLVFDAQGQAVSDITLTLKFAQALWVYEHVVADPSERGGLGGATRVRPHLNTLRDSRLYGASQDLLARALVQAAGALATGGTSVLTSAPGLSMRLVRSNLANLYQVRLEEAGFGLEESLRHYERVQGLTRGLTPQAIDVAKAVSAFDPYARAYTYELGYGALLAVLLPKSNRDLVVNAVNSVTSEVLAVLAPATDDLATWDDIYKVSRAIREALAPVAGMPQQAAVHAAGIRMIQAAKDLIKASGSGAAAGCP
jgi:hypothetical protein